MVFDDVDTITPPKPTSYSLRYFDRDSIKEIKRCITEKKYVSKNMIKDHMEYLQHLHNKISKMLAGAENWELKQILGEVKKLYDILNGMLEKFK